MHKKTETNPKGAGRTPTYTASRNAVTRHFKVKLTPLEYRKMCKNADELGQTPTSHVRQLILASIKPKVGNSVESPTLPQ